MNREVDPKWRFKKSQTVFPELDNDSLVMNIVSYIDVRKKVIRLLKILNSKAYILSQKKQYDRLFVTYLKSELCGK